MSVMHGDIHSSTRSNKQIPQKNENPHIFVLHTWHTHTYIHTYTCPQGIMPNRNYHTSDHVQECVQTCSQHVHMYSFRNISYIHTLNLPKPIWHSAFWDCPQCAKEYTSVHVDIQVSLKTRVAGDWTSYDVQLHRGRAYASWKVDLQV